MVVSINQVSMELELRDAEALLNPRVMARIVAEVKRQLEADERLKSQRAADASANVRGAR